MKYKVAMLLDAKDGSTPEEIKRAINDALESTYRLRDRVEFLQVTEVTGNLNEFAHKTPKNAGQHQ